MGSPPQIETTIHKINKHEDLLYNTGNNIQYLVITYNGNNLKKKKLNCFAVNLKQTQRKSTPLQQKKKLN